MSSSSTSRVQAEAARQAQRLRYDLENYRKTLPTNRSVYHGDGICRADGWNVVYEQLNGDYDLDDALARDVIAQILNANGVSVRSTSSPQIQPIAPSFCTGSWLEEYFAGSSSGNIGTGERYLSESKNATVGAGNIAGNLHALKETANDVIARRATKALKAAAQTIESGAAATVKINPYMTLYNANKSGKGKPRPRIRISGMPMQIVTPALGSGTRIAAGGAVTSALRAVDALKAQNAAKLAAGMHWMGKGAFLSTKLGGGILTFAPSAALDVHSSIERDTNGNSRFNWAKFGIASAKSQTGNALGLVGGMAAAGMATVIFGAAVAGAPVILIGLGAGILVQAVYGASGGADWVEKQATAALTH